jgi:hypothetical protein
VHVVHVTNEVGWIVRNGDSGFARDQIEHRSRRTFAA